MQAAFVLVWWALNLTAVQCQRPARTESYLDRLCGGAGATATLEADTVTELKSLVWDAQHLKWLPTKLERFLASEVSNVARVVVPWRPLLFFW